MKTRIRGFDVHDCEQRSEDWTALRLGRVCASRAHAMLATIQKGESAGRRNLRAQIVLERLTGRSHEKQFQSQAMLDGQEREGAAVALYEAITGVLLQRVGFVSHPDLLAGASPDGIVGNWESFVEVKSPIAATHLDYLKTGKVPDEYWKQMLHLAWLTEMTSAAFVSYQPDFPLSLQLKIAPVTFTPAHILKHDVDVRVFLKEVENELEALLTLTNLPGQLRAAVA